MQNVLVALAIVGATILATTTASAGIHKWWEVSFSGDCVDAVLSPAEAYEAELDGGLLKGTETGELKPNTTRLVDKNDVVELQSHYPLHDLGEYNIHK
jgi:hypothetical protein